MTPGPRFSQELGADPNGSLAGPAVWSSTCATRPPTSLPGHSRSLAIRPDREVPSLIMLTHVLMSANRIASSVTPADKLRRDMRWTARRPVRSRSCGGQARRAYWPRTAIRIEAMHSIVNRAGGLPRRVRARSRSSQTIGFMESLVQCGGLKFPPVVPHPRTWEFGELRNRCAGQALTRVHG